MAKDKVVPLPGIVPQTLINDTAILDSEDVVKRLKTGESVGIAWVEINEGGATRSGWNVPHGMSSNIFVGIEGLKYRMIRRTFDD